jgi:hypothetical protein
VKKHSSPPCHARLKHHQLMGTCKAVPVEYGN